MTDRELLELAAKAAGIEIKGWSDDRPYTSSKSSFGNGFVSWNPVFWNPLADDGDALRLAVNLGMNIVRGYFAVTAEIPPEAENDPGVSEDWPYADDPYAATRRAIVRAAAEIGQRINDQQ